MRGDVTVYSPKNVLCTMGIHIASGFTEDGFITITPQGDGVTDEAGADLGSNPDFTASKAWISKPAPCAYGKTGQSQEWTLRAVGKMEPKN